MGDENPAKGQNSKLGELKMCMLHSPSSSFIAALLAMAIAKCIDHQKRYVQQVDCQKCQKQSTLQARASRKTINHKQSTKITIFPVGKKEKIPDKKIAAHLQKYFCGNGCQGIDLQKYLCSTMVKTAASISVKKNKGHQHWNDNLRPCLVTTLQKEKTLGHQHPGKKMLTLKKVIQQVDCQKCRKHLWLVVIIQQPTKTINKTNTFLVWQKHTINYHRLAKIPLQQWMPGH